MRILAAAPKPKRFTKEQAESVKIKVMNRVANSKLYPVNCTLNL